MTNQKRQLIDLSFLSILKFFLVVIFLIFLYVIKDILAILFVSLIFSSAIDPWVDKMERIRFPRWLSMLLIYIILFAIIFGAVYLIIPPIVAQTEQLSNNFPSYFEKVTSTITSVRNYSAEHGILSNLNQAIDGLKNNLNGAVQGVFSTIIQIFGGILAFLVMLVVTFYMTVEETAVKKTLAFLVPEKYHPFTLKLINKVQQKIGDWLKGQLVLCLIIGVMSYVGLTILGVNYALILALIAGIGEFFPYVGPILTAIPAIFIAFTMSPIKALFVLILYVVIQQLENHLLVPKVMQKAVGINPIISIIALLIGAQIAGFVGIVLAIPVATAICVIAQELWSAKEDVEEIKEEVVN